MHMCMALANMKLQNTYMGHQSQTGMPGASELSSELSSGLTSLSQCASKACRLAWDVSAIFASLQIHLSEVLHRRHQFVSGVQQELLTGSFYGRQNPGASAAPRPQHPSATVEPWRDEKTEL